MAAEVIVQAKWAGRKLDEWLHAEFPGKSRAAWQKEVRRGKVRVDGKRIVRSNVRLRGQERVRVEDVSSGARVSIEVLFEDEDLLVVSKPAGLLTHEASERLDEETLAGLLDSGKYGPLPRLLGEERPGIVHRLDRETSGLVVVARTEGAFVKMRQAFKERRVEKRYAAVVARSEQAPTENSFECESPIGASPGQRDKQRVDSKAGKASKTRFVVAERLGGSFSVLHCFPETGRRHQIRVHLQALGFQLLGDSMYRVKDAAKIPQGLTRMKRHALHAAGIGFAHPRTGERVEVETEGLPEDMERVVLGLRGN